MRTLILFLALAVSAGCAKEMSSFEIETEVEDRCNQRLDEGTTSSFKGCYDSEIVDLIEEQNVDCEVRAELRPLDTDACWFFLDNETENCDPGAESCT